MACEEILVVGGGIGGLTTALALARAGCQVHVLERAPAFTEIGAGLQLAPNATRVLDALGVLDDAASLGVLPDRLVARNAVTGQELTHLDLHGATRLRYGAPYLVMHRSDLLDVLLHACEADPSICLQVNKTVDTIDNLPDRALVTCSDGSTYEARVVVGADGLGSRTRELVSDDTPINSGFVAYRGTFSPEGSIEHLTSDSIVVWLGPGLHLVQYPLRPGGTLYNQVAVFRSDQFAAGQKDWGGPDELAERFAVTGPAVQRALDDLWKDRRWEMHDRLPLSRWSLGRTILVGDAAHPMLQYLAQGSCQALEDASALALALSAHMDHDWPMDALEKAFKTYEEARIPRTARVQKSARVWGDIWHVDGLAMTLRDEAFRLRKPDDYRRIDWLYGPVQQ